MELSKKVIYIEGFGCFYVDGEDRVAARGVLVHCSGARLPILHAREKHLFELWHALDDHSREVLNEDAFVRIFLDLQKLLRRTASQQIQNVLVINLEVTATD